MSKFTYVIAGVGILILIGIGWYAYSRPAVVANNQPLKVGAMLLLSGDFASYGGGARNGVELAVQEYNANPKNTRKVEVVYEDTKADPKTAVSAYRKLTSVDHVDAILGPMLQTEMSAIAPIIKDDKMPVFAMTYPDMALRGQIPNLLVVWPNPTLESEKFAQYLYDEEHVRSVAILGTQDSWEAEVCAAFEKKFKELGGTVVDTEIVLQTDESPSVAVTKALAKKPEALFIGSYYRFIYFVNKAKELGFKGKLYSIEVDSSMLQETQPYSNGLRFISPEFFTDAYVTAFQQLAGSKPNIPSGQTYDAMSILLSIMPTAVDRADAVQKMSTLGSFDGASGHITFSTDRQATFPVNIFEAQGADIVRVK